MRTTKKILSAVLAVCMLASTSIVSGFAANSDSESTGVDNAASRANEALDAEYTYTKGDLGATYSKEQTVFKVWSPTATEVKLNRYATGSDSESGAANLGTVEMEKLMDGEKWTGVWTTTVEGDIVDTYYTYTITADKATGGALATHETQDIYSVATGVNGRRSMVCDLDKTDPEGWDKDVHVVPDRSTQSSVWEIHVKDFSYDPASGVSEKNRGKYLAFTETGTKLEGTNVSTCIDYLKQLGITTVQINPFYDFQSINEAGDDTQFNWGYDPQNYNVPEGSYSSNPYDGNVRITECKQMIQALHNAGISVVMDVVYNHTYSTDSSFQYTVPNYYYRMKNATSFSDGSGCGNECASERAMFRDFMIQSIMYWVNEYHVDGFRFDLMGLIDVETMNLIREAMDEVNPLLTTWGEGWTGGTSNHPTKTCTGGTFAACTQANAGKTNERVAFFNDAVRNAVKGTVFDINEMGFIAGNRSYAKDIKYGITANSKTKNGWQAKMPSQSVTYAACHDNATLYDQILASTKLAGYGERNDTAVKMNKLAGAVVYGLQGVSFMLAGEEMGRTKYGDTNSYKSDPEINMIQWKNIVDYADLVSYYKGVMAIKRAFTPLSAMDKSYEDGITLTGLEVTPSNQVSFTMTNDQEGEWKKLAVMFNSAATETTVTLADKSVTDWVIVVNDQCAGFDNLGEVSGSSFKVPAYSAVFAVDKESFESTAFESNTGKVVVQYQFMGGKKLADSVTLQGEIGSAYQTAPSASVPNTYVLDSVEGEDSGVYTAETKTVTYFYKNFVPESIVNNGDADGDGIITINDVTVIQKYLVGFVDKSDEKDAAYDLNYDDNADINDATMLQKHIAGMAVSTGTVEVNHYYYDKNGDLSSFTDTETITGRVGDEFTTSRYKVVGYAPDPDKYPAKSEGKIPYGATLKIDYYYIASSLDVKLHIKHTTAATDWQRTNVWIWGSDLDGVDAGNYTSSKQWPGDALSALDDDGWYLYEFTCTGAGTYNVIVNKNSGSPQSRDYKQFVDNELWIVIDDSAAETGTFITPYTENPEVNPNAPIADFKIS